MSSWHRKAKGWVQGGVYPGSNVTHFPSMVWELEAVDPSPVLHSWPSNRTGSSLVHSLQVGGVYSYDCSFGHVPNVELMKFIAMATFGSYLSTCPEPEPSNLGLTVYHRAFLLYSFLRSGEALNPEYYCGKARPCERGKEGWLWR